MKRVTKYVIIVGIILVISTAITYTNIIENEKVKSALIITNLIVYLATIFFLFEEADQNKTLIKEEIMSRLFKYYVLAVPIIESMKNNMIRKKDKLETMKKEGEAFLDEINKLKESINATISDPLEIYKKVKETYKRYIELKTKYGNIEFLHEHLKSKKTLPEYITFEEYLQTQITQHFNKNRIKGDELEIEGDKKITYWIILNLLKKKRIIRHPFKRKRDVNNLFRQIGEYLYKLSTNNTSGTFLNIPDSITNPINSLEKEIRKETFKIYCKKYPDKVSEVIVKLKSLYHPDSQEFSKIMSNNEKCAEMLEKTYSVLKLSTQLGSEDTTEKELIQEFINILNSKDPEIIETKKNTIQKWIENNKHIQILNNIEKDIKDQLEILSKSIRVVNQLAEKFEKTLAEIQKEGIPKT